LLLTGLLVSTQAQAVTIVTAGSVTDNASGQVTGWRTSSVAKSSDIDSNNVYGSLGAVVWGDGDGSSNHTTSTVLTTGTSAAGVLGWTFVSQAVNPDVGIGLQSFVHTQYTPIDNFSASGMIVPGVGSISSGNGVFTFQLNGTAADYLGRTVRIGIMQDYLEPGASGDGNHQFILSGPGGASANFTTPAVPNHIADLYFWDVTGVSPGDQFSITGFANPGGGGGSLASLGTITMDLSAVPEPSAALLGGLAGLALIRRRR
jgi:hypothetical protein